MAASESVPEKDRAAAAFLELGRDQTKAIQRLGEVLAGAKPPWTRVLDATLATAPTTMVAVIGFYAVHRFSVRRQRRDEFFKTVQAVQEHIKATTSDAVRVWSVSAGTADLVGLAEGLTDRVGRISSQLAMLTRRQQKFDPQAAMIEYRQAVTTDIEAQPRVVDPQRAGQVRAASLSLEEAVEEGYLRVFG